MFQVTPQMHILVGTKPVDGRKGIDSLAQLYRAELQEDPFSGCLFLFRNKCATTLAFKLTGENLRDVLLCRAKELEAPVLMCDALSWNTSKLNAPDAVNLAHCIAHGRRKLVEVAPSFPKECLYVLEELSLVYRNDHSAQEAKMTPSERLKYHKQHSAPIMDRPAAKGQS